MTRTKKSMLTAAAVAALGLLAATGASYADRGEGCGFGKHGKQHGPGDRGAKIFEKFDLNEDGTVTKAEAEEASATRMTAADKNNDGQMSLEEFQTVWLEMTRPMMVDRFQDLDEDANGAVTAAEFDRPISKIFVYMDENGDGSITIAELRNMHGKHGRHHEDHDDD